jgi:hypothetical protein
MSRYIYAVGFFEDEPQNETEVIIDKGEWGGEADARDDDVFYYLCGDPLAVGDNLGGFIVTSFEEAWT